LTFSEKLLFALKKSGKTARQLATYLNVGESLISKVKHGHSELSPDNIAKLAEFTNTPVEYFIRTDVINIEDLELTPIARQILQDRTSVSYLVLVDHARSSGLTPQELEQAINFAAQMKKQGSR
jgi:transcriptional regulator with XRE-family HTH domain